jgi:hypothetical protein
MENGYIATIHDINELSGKYTTLTSVPDTLNLCVTFKRLSEYDTELKPTAASYQNEQLVQLQDIQPMINSFNIVPYVNIYNISITDDPVWGPNGSTHYYYSRYNYEITAISFQTDIYHICVENKIPSADLNVDPDDVYEYKGMTFVFINPYKVFSDNEAQDGMSTVIKLNYIDYAMGMDEKKVQPERFFIRKLKTKEPWYNESEYIADSIHGTEVGGILYDETANADRSVKSCGFVIEIRDLPYDRFKTVSYNFIVRGTNEYVDKSTSDFEYRITISIDL